MQYSANLICLLRSARGTINSVIRLARQSARAQSPSSQNYLELIRHLLQILRRGSRLSSIQYAQLPDRDEVHYGQQQG